MASMPYIVTNGIVLRETETKDADKILTLLTAERGKISVIARGVRRRRCKYAACAQSLAWSEWSLTQRGEWYYANEGSTLELFDGLRTDLAAMALGFYFAELTEAVTNQDEGAPELLRHLLNGLYAMSTARKPPPLTKPAFELKLLCLAGYEPLADSCAYCGRTDPEHPMLDVVQGVLRCGRCGAEESALSMPAVPGFPGGVAAYCLRRPQAAVLLHFGSGCAAAPERRGGGFCRRPAGTGIPDPGFL